MQRWKLVAAVAAVAAVVIASVIVLLVTQSRESARRPEPPEPSRTRIAPPTSAPAPTASSTMNEDAPSTDDQRAQVRVCNNYLDAFLQPGTPDERAARLREWGTPQNVEQAKQTDPRRLSTAKRKGDCTLDPGAAHANQAQAHVQLTDGTWWAFTLVKDLTVAAQWRVHAATREGH